jgi:hypothetical protein
MQWFAQVLQSAPAVTALGSYVDFDTIGEAALEMTAIRRGVSLSASDRAAILDGRLDTHTPPEQVRLELAQASRGTGTWAPVAAPIRYGKFGITAENMVGQAKALLGL